MFKSIAIWLWRMTPTAMFIWITWLIMISGAPSLNVHENVLILKGPRGRDDQIRPDLLVRSHTVWLCSDPL